MSALIPVDDANFEAVALRDELPMLVEFSSPT
jgi:hypothetical protein